MYRSFGLLGALLIGGACAGIAWAAIPGSDGVIHGCYQKGNGELRVVDTSGKGCKKGELPISWNQAGPRGEQGEPGQPGQSGEPGVGYVRFAAGEGGVDAIPLPESPADPAHVLTLDVPSGWVADSEDNWRDGVTGLVAVVSVLFSNNSPVVTHPDCVVLTDEGGYADGHMYLSGADGPATTSLTFQAASQPDQAPPNEIGLWCSVGSDHPPLPGGGSPDVRVLRADLTVMPRSF